MNALEFVASIVNSVAWPTAVFASVYLFRHELGRVLEGLRSVRYKEFRAEFGRQVEVIRAEAAAFRADADIRLPSLQGASEAQAVDSQLAWIELRKIAAVEPTVALTTAWGELLSVLLALHRRADARTTRPTDASNLIGELKVAGLLQEAQADALNRLRRLRNLAVHAPESAVDAKSAEDFIAAAEGIARQLEAQL